LPEFQDIRLMKVVRLPTLRTGRLYLQLISLVLIFIRGRVEPRAIVRPERGDVKVMFREFRVTSTFINWQVVFPNVNTSIRMEVHCVNFTVQTRGIIKCDCEFNMIDDIIYLIAIG